MQNLTQPHTTSHSGGILGGVEAVEKGAVLKMVLVEGMVQDLAQHKTAAHITRLLPRLDIVVCLVAHDKVNKLGSLEHLLVHPQAKPKKGGERGGFTWTLTVPAFWVNCTMYMTLYKYNMPH